MNIGLIAHDAKKILMQNFIFPNLLFFIEFVKIYAHLVHQIRGIITVINAKIILAKNVYLYIENIYFFQLK